ncbi:MAG: hypothetical protein ACLQAT_17135 [Candidatus Binataceae bacterium]
MGKYGKIVAGVGVVVGIIATLLQLTNVGTSVSAWVGGAALVLLLVGFAGTLEETSMRLDELTTAVRNELPTGFDIARAGYWNVKEPDSIYIRASSKVLSDIVADYIPRMANGLKQLTTMPNSTLDVHDTSPIHALMHNLGSALPEGSVWFGITLLEDVGAWTGPEENRFNRFRDLMRERAKLKTLWVLRLYYFDSEANFQRMNDEMATEHRNGIVVKYIIGGAAPPDISLVWAPSRGATRLAFPRDAKDPIDFVAAPQFEKVCGLQYDTHAGEQLKRVRLYPGRSPEFEELVSTFNRAWVAALEFPPQAKQE